MMIIATLFSECSFEGSPTELSSSDSEPENDAAQKRASETATIIEISDDEALSCCFTKLFRWRLLVDIDARTITPAQGDSKAICAWVDEEEQFQEQTSRSVQMDVPRRAKTTTCSPSGIEKSAFCSPCERADHKNQGSEHTAKAVKLIFQCCKLQLRAHMFTFALVRSLSNTNAPKRGERRGQKRAREQEGKRARRQEGKREKMSR